MLRAAVGGGEPSHVSLPVLSNQPWNSTDAQNGLLQVVILRGSRLIRRRSLRCAVTLLRRTHKSSSQQADSLVQNQQTGEYNANQDLYNCNPTEHWTA